MEKNNEITKVLYVSTTRSWEESAVLTDTSLGACVLDFFIQLEVYYDVFDKLEIRRID